MYIYGEPIYSGPISSQYDRAIFEKFSGTKGNPATVSYRLRQDGSTAGIRLAVETNTCIAIARLMRTCMQLDVIQQI